jgi:hypothetical protein
MVALADLQNLNFCTNPAIAVLAQVFLTKKNAALHRLDYDTRCTGLIV